MMGQAYQFFHAFRWPGGAGKGAEAGANVGRGEEQQKRTTERLMFIYRQYYLIRPRGLQAAPPGRPSP